MKQEMHPLAQLARKAVEGYVDGRGVLDPGELVSEMKERAGVFVSLKKHGQLRGCIGTFEPTQPNVAEEIIRNAISSATGDPRFSPVRPGELNELEYSVDVLTFPEPVEDKSLLDSKKYGVIVEAGRRRGLLLPDLEGVDDVATQVDIAMRKAGISDIAGCDIERFKVDRYT